MRKNCLLFFFFSVITLMAQAQSRKITGTVADENAQPLQRATVTVKGSSASTSTNASGQFSLEIPASVNVLVISFVGMESQEVKIGSKSNYSINLKSAVTSLSDVVVVGYGTVRKTDLTGAAQRITRDEMLRDNPTNVLQAMQGKLAGVNVTQNDGAPGAGLSIRVRGSNSFLGGTEPLYVIDGIPFNNSNSNSTPASIGSDEMQTLNVLSFLNVNDIESIDVLKDASATAIYGSRGANGVVLITTRKGRSGKDRVELSVNIGLAEVSRKLDVLTPSEYAGYQNLAYANANKYDLTNYTQPYSDSAVNALRSNNTNWQEAIMRRALYQQYAVNVSGGSELGNHSLSLNYINQDGTIINSDYKKLGLSFNLNRNLGKYFKIGTSTAVSSTTNHGVKTGTDKSDAASAGVIRSALTFPTTIETEEEYNGSGEGYFITNPVIYSRDVLNRVRGINVFTSNYVEINFPEFLKFRQNLGFNYGSSTRDQYYPRTVYEGYSVKGWGLKADNLWNSLVSESILTYHQKFNKHSLTATGAGTFERTNGESKRAEAKTFPNDLLQNDNLQSAELVMPVINSRYQSTLISFLGRINYSFNEKYLITASYRRDGSSKFGKDNKWAGFTSGAVAWKVHKEKFMDKLDAISDLTFRLSYGQTGNQGVGAYASLSKLAVYNYTFNGVLQTGLADDVAAGPANSTLKWETTSAWNAGLDLGLWKNTLNLHVEVYRKKTNNLLQYVVTPPSSGFERQLKNSGNVENKGIEVLIDAQVIRKKDFQWKSSFNIAFNRNKILSLGADVKEQYANNISTGDAPFIQVPGQPIGALYGYVEDGFYDNEAEVRSSPLYANQSFDIIRRMVGEIKYRNFDNDPTSITANDRQIIGNVNPDYTFGFTNNFRYRNFDLSVFVNGVQGNDIINMNKRFTANIGTGKNITQEVLDGAWADGKDNSNATDPKVMRQFWRTILFSRRFIEDGSFVRIKNVTLGYTVPGKLIKGISSLRLSLGINNLYTFTNYSGYDPEINSYGDNPALFGVDLGGYPNSRTCNFTIRCGF
ncbi:MAG TPA: TonB-dependent receptor [Ferruginibacter sp.]|nr:TonB-dependent receptor [Ferruginibacter sp.]